MILAEMGKRMECMVVLEGTGTSGGLRVVGKGQWNVVWMVVLEEIGNLPMMVSCNKVHTHKVRTGLASKVPSGVHACLLRLALLLPLGRAIEESLVAEQEVVRFAGQDGFEHAQEIGIGQNRPYLHQSESCVPE